MLMSQNVNTIVSLNSADNKIITQILAIFYNLTNSYVNTFYVQVMMAKQE